MSSYLCKWRAHYNAEDEFLVEVVFARLRSGRAFAHPLEIESAIIQVHSLSALELAPMQNAVSCSSSRSTTTTEAFLQSSPAAPGTSTTEVGSPGAGESQTSTTAPWTPQRWDSDAGDSQASTIAPWTPQRGSLDVPRRYRYTGHQPVPTWFAEVFESDGCDSESIALIATPPQEPGPVSTYPSVAPFRPPSQDPATPCPRPRRTSMATSVDSSPGFIVVGDTALNSARDDWHSEACPVDVEFLRAQILPRNLKFPVVSSGTRRATGCGCNVRCNAYSCLNAKSARFCTESNCTFGGVCGNALRESPALAISRNLRTGMRGSTATKPIPAGEIIGIIGQLQERFHLRVDAALNHRRSHTSTREEYVAIECNAQRPHQSSELDYEALRRKFRKLNGTKYKPTGINTLNDVPALLKPAAWAHEIQRAIEAKAGAQTSHDESDHGDDDDLLQHVAHVTSENMPSEDLDEEEEDDGEEEVEGESHDTKRLLRNCPSAYPVTLPAMGPEKRHATLKSSTMAESRDTHKASS
ncbi:hypothetical protein ON010_g10891 [Phytophthora cinnamomi]|nr:hypothetical protein ON010_g10891 [Phytophthora cinnamomi]